MLTLRFAPILLASLLALACGGRRQRVHVTPLPVTTANVEVAAPQTGCQVTLAVGAVETRAGCTIDERVSGQSAILNYDCAGGPASVDFGGSYFQGNVAGDEVDVSIETTFPFSDGCQWRSKQRISGILGTGVLAYTYEERPDPGQAGCSNGCLAEAAVSVR